MGNWPSVKHKSLTQRRVLGTPRIVQGHGCTCHIKGLSLEMFDDYDPHRASSSPRDRLRIYQTEQSVFFENAALLNLKIYARTGLVYMNTVRRFCDFYEELILHNLCKALPLIYGRVFFDKIVFWLCYKICKIFSHARVSSRSHTPLTPSVFFERLLLLQWRNLNIFDIVFYPAQVGRHSANKAQLLFVKFYSWAPLNLDVYRSFGVQNG